MSKYVGYPMYSFNIVSSQLTSHNAVFAGVIVAALTCCARPDADRPPATAPGAVPVWSDAAAWRLSDTPDIVIGSAAGQSDALVYVRGATKLVNGNVAVLDMGVPGIRFYDPAGSHIRTVGREGEGPGEFAVPASLTRIEGDTLLVADPILRRITVMDSAGTVARVLQPTPIEGGDIAVIGPVGNSHVLIRAGDIRVWRDGLVRDTVLLGMMETASGLVTILARLPDTERVVELQNASGYQSQRVAPFGRQAHFAAGEGAYYTGISDLDRIEQYDIAGNAGVVIGGVRMMASVPRDGAERYWEATLTANTRRDRLKRYRDPSIAPATMPLFDGLRVDASGNIWVRRYAPPWSPPPSLWDVHDGNGIWLGTVAVPTGRTRLRDRPDLLEVGHDYVLVLEQDEMDVLRVASYRLIK